MNETIAKFGYPASLVAEYEHWLVLVRPAQPTLGSVVLAAKSHATAFSDLPAEAHAELKHVTTKLEAALQAFVGYDKLNYLMLMMVDPHVHFHVIPRYEGERTWSEHTFTDVGWPKTPELGAAIALSAEDMARLVSTLSSHF